MVHMALTDLGRRFGNWLGIEPDELDTDLAPGGDAAARALALEPVAAHERTSPGGTEHTSRVPAAPRIASSPALDDEIAELRRVVLDLRSGLEPHPRT